MKRREFGSKTKGIKLGLPFKEGLTLEIKRLSLTRSSEVEEQEERILKSSRNEYVQFRKDVLKYWVW